MILFAVAPLFAQNPREQFERFKSQAEKDFERTRQQQDSIFAKSIVDNWQAIQVSSFEKTPQPRPEEQPKSEPSLELLDLEHQFIETQPKLMRSFKPTTLEYNQEYEPELERSITFFGEQMRIRYSADLLCLSDFEISSKVDLSKAWQRLSKTTYQPLVNSLHKKRLELQLPDFGYLSLLETLLNDLDVSSKNLEVYKWFLLVKSGYAARIGLINNSPVLVVGSFGKIYGKRYYSSAGINYYVLSDAKGELESYIIDSDVNNAPFDLSVNEEIRLPLNHAQREISYSSRFGKTINVKILYNSNVVEMLRTFPQSDIAYYLTSRPSDLLAKSLENSLLPYMADLSEVQRVNFLLEFVQKGFTYQSDSRQFGKERVLYPEEVFSYPYSDCDDRVVLLAYLLRTFVDVPMVALGFPQHIALGLKLSSPVFGESIKYNGYKFTFCDPTYLNAPLGAVIPSADRDQLRVIEF